jgi:hypothetical protein
MHFSGDTPDFDATMTRLHALAFHAHISSMKKKADEIVEAYYTALRTLPPTKNCMHPETLASYEVFVAAESNGRHRELVFEFQRRITQLYDEVMETELSDTEKLDEFIDRSNAIVDLMRELKDLAAVHMKQIKDRTINLLSMN